VANSITFKVKVEKDGNLKVVAKEAGAASKATDNLGKSTDRLSKSRSNYHKQEKGVGQAGLSSAKSFSKMQQTMGSGSSGLVGAYAVLAANVFALTAAFGALQRAAQVKQLEDGLRAMGTASGVAMQTLAEGLQETTGHALSLADAMRATALATSAGFDSSSIERLGDVARKASIALGRDTADSLNRLTKGAIKLEPELLDELGIMVRLDEATENYARSLGKNANELTTFQKRQAFMNAVLEEGESKFGSLGDVDTNPFDKLSATFQDLTKTLINVLNKGILPVVSFFANSQAALLGALILFGKGIATAMIPALQDLGAKFAIARREAAATAISMASNIKQFEGGSKGVRNFVESLKEGPPTQKELNKALNSANKSLVRNTADLNTLTTAEEKNIDQIRRKKALLRESQTTVNTLATASFNLATANLAEGDANAIAAASQGKYSEALKLTGTQFDGYTKATNTAKKGTSGLTKATIVFSGAAAKAGLAARVFGTALLNMIPLIGQIIAIFGIFVSVVKSVNEAMKSDETKEYETLIARVRAEVDELTLSLKELEKARRGERSSIDGAAGRYETMSTALSGFQKTVDELNEKPLMSPGLLSGTGDYQNILSKLVKEQPLFRDQITEIAKEFTNNGFVLEGLSSGMMFMSKTTEAMSKAILNKALPALREFPDAMKNMTVTTKEAGNAISDFINKDAIKTSVDAVLASFKEIELSMVDLTNVSKEKAKDLFLGFKQRANKDLQGLIDMDQIIKDNRRGGMGPSSIDYKGVVKDIQAAITKEKEFLEQRRKEEAVGKIIGKTFQAELGFLKKRTLVLGTAQKIMDAEEGIRKNNEDSMKRQIKDVERQITLGKDVKLNTTKKLELEKQLEIIEKSKVSETEKELRLEQEKLGILENSQKAERALLDFLRKSNDLKSKALDLEEQSAIMALEAANLADPNNRGKAEVSAAQKYAAIYQKVGDDEKTINQRRIDQVVEEFRVKKVMIGLEHAMLKARMTVLKAELRNTLKMQGKTEDQIKKELTPFDTIEKGLKGQLDLAEAVLDAERQAALDQIENARLKALADVREQFRTGGTTDSGVGSSGEAQTVLSNATPTATPNAEGTGTTTGTTETGATALDKIGRIKTELQSMMEFAGDLGPGGELVNAVAGGALVIADAWTVAGSKISGSINTLDEGAAVATAAAATFQQIGAIMAAASQNKIAGIDREIAAEKKRDGKSKESLAKIKALEAKKVAMQKKQFEINKKIQMASIIANTAAGIMKTIGDTGFFGSPLAMIIAAMGAAQLAVVAGTSFQGGGGGAAPSAGPTSVAIGKRGTTSDLSRSQSARGELAYFRGERGTGGAENFRPAFYGKKTRATGGYVVGEQGPELFMPDRPGTIVPADDTAAMAQGVGNVNININAIDASGVEEVLTQQQGNIIAMIRQAANQTGEDFLEAVDETTYTTPAIGRA